MTSAQIDPNFASWRSKARTLLQSGISPGEVLWSDGSETGDLFGASPAPERGEAAPPSPTPVRIPRAFMALAKLVSCHSDPERWALLYRMAWRLTRGGEPHLLQIETDDEVSRAARMSSAVRRDRHKMAAFVRFRKVGSHPGSGREQFVAWFEPDHHIVELTAPFFVRRFASMDWSILTPRRCAHWDGHELQFTDGVTRESAPAADELDDYWRTYYASIFNPARLKLQAMQSEMPRKYWKNLPEAPLIAELTAGAASRTQRMIIQGPNHEREHVSRKIPAGVPDIAPPPDLGTPAEVLARADDLSWRDLHDAAMGCAACPLHEKATRTVFGEGPSDAAIMLVGEQPGDQEDLVGRPFVGPAGQLLNAALEEAGINRDEVYLTNTVKHFKWQPRGKHRLHAKPNAGEVRACKPWVLTEVLKIRPRVLVCLGSTAAQALIDPAFSITRQRGPVDGCPLAPHVVATVHPSYLLRMRDQTGDERARFVRDLATAARLAQE